MNDIINQNKEQLLGLLANTSEVGIVVGGHSQDKMAGALALYLSLLNTGKNPQIVALKDPLVEVSNLVGVDRVKRKFEGEIKTLVLSVPYREKQNAQGEMEGEIQKVSYNIEGDRLNVNLFAGDKGFTFTEKDIQYIKQGSAPTLIITIGIRDFSEIEELVGPSNSLKVINIDCSSQNSFYGDIPLVDPSFSSVSEMVARIINDLSFPIDIDIAQNLMDGIVHATHNFSLPTTSPFAFETVGVLMRYGAQRKQQAAGNFHMQNTAKKDPKKEQFDSKRQPQFDSRNPLASLSQDGQGGLQRTSIHDKPMNSATQKPYVQNNPVVSSQEETSADEAFSEEDIPSDWFVPKVFKGSKKQN